VITLQSDFNLITRHFKANDDIIIYPISDVHLGAKEHLAKEWTSFCNQIMQIPNAYIVLGGDLINNSTRNSVANVFEETMRPREQKRVMAEMLMPIKDRILCAVTGNHERRSAKDADDDPTYDILCKLDIEDVYRENIAFLKLQFGDIQGQGSKNPTYVLAITHGAGGGMLTGGSVNRNERFGYVIDGMDCLIVGHTHKPFITQPSKLKVDTHNNKVSLKPFKVVSSTSWLAYGGYAAQKMLLPASHAPQEIVLCGNHKEIKVTM
jgi:predicted phosphodiesterase